MNALYCIGEERGLPDHGGPGVEVGMPRVENVAVADGGMDGMVNGSTGGEGRGARAGPGRPWSLGGEGAGARNDGACGVVLCVVGGGGGGGGGARRWWRGECADGGWGRWWSCVGWHKGGLVLRLRVHSVDANDLVITSECPCRGALPRYTGGGGVPLLVARLPALRGVA